MDIIKQIANGCLYLEENQIVHRDLAARNCLLNEEESDKIIVKISDLGLARDVYYTKIYTTETNRKLPFRWMAPESIFQLIFTSKSDVWLVIFCKYFLICFNKIAYFH
jgi:serine/threonine protein kinase